MKNNVLWIAAAGIAIFLVSRFSFSKKLNFIFQSIKTGGSVLQPTVDVTIALQNPTNQQVTVKSISGQILLNDKFISNISSFQPVNISPNSESYITIKARPSLFGVITTIKNVLTNKTGNNNFLITGNANVDNVSIPFSMQETI